MAQHKTAVTPLLMHNGITEVLHEATVLCFSLAVTEGNMASAGESPNELITCTLCEEPYDDNHHKAKFLACHHTFCSNCLSQWQRKKHQPNTNSIRCPVCNQITDVPDSGVNGLQTNFYIERMIKISKETEESKSVKKQKGCQKHGNQQKFFFCETCNMAICHNCTVLDHQKTEGHVITGIQEATESHRHTLEHQLKRSQATEAEIQGAIQEIESKMHTIQEDKDSATENLTAFIQFAQCELEQWRQKATDAISQHHAAQHSKLLGKKIQLQQARGLLEKHVNQSKETAETDDISDIISSKGKLEKATKIATLDITDQKRNRFESGLILSTNPPNDMMRDIGKAWLQSIPPISAVLRNNKLTAGLKSVITLELFNDAGNKVPFAAPFLAIQITGPQQQELPVTLNTAHPECTVAFTPQTSGKHEIALTYMGHKLQSKETHIMVDSNNPLLKFGKKGGGKGTFAFPSGIAISNHCLYVVDTGNRLIQKFTTEGEFLSQFRIDINGADYSTCDMAVDEYRGLIICTEISMNNFVNPVKGNKVLVFNLEGQFQREYTNTKMLLPLCITIDTHGNAIISDSKRNAMFIHDRDGNLIGEMGNSEILKSPSYMCMQEDNSIIVSDKDNDCIRICNLEGKFTHQIGSYGYGNGQLRTPNGVATDGEYILVADWGKDCIQVFRHDGTFAFMIESETDRISSIQGLAITPDGYVYVVDRDKHCIKKYKYKDMP